MSQDALKDRIRIFNRSGVELASFQASISRSWAIGREGRASFEYPSRKTDVVNENVLQFGNYLLVENSRLPAWVGIIDTPREWDKDVITVNAYTLERLFKYRIGTPDDKLSGSAGQIWKKLIDTINSAEKTILVAGEAWDGGTSREETLTANSIENNLKQLQERSGEDYNFRPVILRGKLVVYGDWYKSLGVETPLTLLEGGNIESATMREDGTIINSVLGYGDGITWTSRQRAIEVNTDSVASYGLRQDGEEYTGVTVLTTVQNNNSEYIRRNSKPRKIFQITALNVGDTFDYIALGNRVNVKFTNMGFYNSAIGTFARTRILGMSYNPRQGQKIKLVLEDV